MPDNNVHVKRLSNWACLLLVCDKWECFWFLEKMLIWNYNPWRIKIARTNCFLHFTHSFHWYPYSFVWICIHLLHYVRTMYVLFVHLSLYSWYISCYTHIYHHILNRLSCFYIVNPVNPVDPDSSAFFESFRVSNN